MDIRTEFFFFLKLNLNNSWSFWKTFFFRLLTMRVGTGLSSSSTTFPSSQKINLILCFWRIGRTGKKVEGANSRAAANFLLPFQIPILCIRGVGVKLLFISWGKQNTYFCTTVLFLSIVFLSWIVNLQLKVDKIEKGWFLLTVGSIKVTYGFYQFGPGTYRKVIWI